VKTILTNRLLAAHYFELSANQSHLPTHFYSYLKLFIGDGLLISKSLAAFDYELSTYQGFAPTQLQCALMFVGVEPFLMNKMICSSLS
jgi:hypothetical protein